MTIELKLDTNALSSLIEKDDTFRLKLQAAVIENIAGRYVKGTSSDVAQAVEAACTLEKNKIVALFGEYNKSSWSGSSTIRLNAVVIDAIKTAVNDCAKAEVKAIVDAAVKEQVAKLDLLVKSKIEESMRVHTHQLISAEVKSRIEQAIAQIKI